MEARTKPLTNAALPASGPFRRLRAACIAALVCAAVAWAQDAGGVEWLLEDGLSQEGIGLEEADVTTPVEYREALALYRAGEYRRAVEILEKSRRLMLPDGNLDYVCLALAEAYRAMGVRERAEDNYRYVLAHFPQSGAIAPSLFRQFQFAVADENVVQAESLLVEFRRQHLKHPLYSSVLYELARLRYQLNRPAEAIDLVSSIPRNSCRYVQAQFLSALCYYQTKNEDKCLLLLDFVRKNAPDERMVAEAVLLIGDIYLNKGDTEAALRHYSSMPPKAARYPYASVKRIRCLVDLGRFGEARDQAREFAARNPDSEYFFEVMSLLEQAYVKLEEKDKAEEAARIVLRQVGDARMSFETYGELNKVRDDLVAWRKIGQTAEAESNTQLLTESRRNIGRLETLEKKYWALLRDITPPGKFDRQRMTADLAVLRYLNQLREATVGLEDSLLDLQDRIDRLRERESRGGDTTMSDTTRLLVQRMDESKKELSRRGREYALVAKEFGAEGKMGLDEEGPAKYVDWAFMKHLAKKEELREMSRRLAARDSSDGTPDSLKVKGRQVARIFGSMDRDRFEADLRGERGDLIRQIEMILSFFPRNRYNAQVLFRLAELYNDEAGDDFDNRLREYEKRMAQGGDSASLQFPEYNLTRVVAIYDRIIENHPRSEVADDAMFYKALALRKSGDEDAANGVLREFAQKYPESEFFVEANMLVGRYYFERPRLDSGTGYKLAENAFREVLYYRDHPQFVQALYNLGWCYYMQDQYEEAIAVFKYLIEEVALDFDPTKVEEEQVVNPLLRGEAIDYIAISFDEEGRLDEAVQFLKLVGNVDYAAMVLMRIGELRQEVQDYKGATEAFLRVLQEYGDSRAAPDAAASLIRIYDLQNMSALGLEQREKFVASYARGSAWSVQMARKDSAVVAHADSMAISNALYVADILFRRAEAAGSADDYGRAAQSYGLAVQTYPQDSRTADSRWNLAVILDQKLGRQKEAYDEYLQYSRMNSAPADRREQAALNAIALVQRMLPPDSAVEQGKLEPAAVGLIEAVNNYAEQCPQGSSLGDVMLTMGAVYFNRKMYTNAAKVYAQVVARGPTAETFYHALFMQGQCLFGEENWPAASKAFEEVSKKSSDLQRRAEAAKLFLQSEYLYAKQFFAAGDYEKASKALLSIDDRFPGSQYGDVVLYNAAESFEKVEKWEDACNSYLRLAKSYAESKLAPDALFNAAENYQKAGKFDKSAETYEALVAQYPRSDKAKDALFNVGFCYEKMGKIELMAQANERYTALYPEEKDARAMLFRAGGFYLKAGMFEKARNVYRNFVRRFANEPEGVEALFMVGRTYLDEKDTANALSGFAQTEQQNQRLVDGKLKPNSFHAAEAAFLTAEILRRRFDAVSFDQLADKAREAQQKKTELLNQAAKAYTRVVQYQSPRMFESAYRIGEMYVDFSKAWAAQARPSLDPIKAAVLEKDVLQASSALLQKAFVPFRKAMEMASGFDSLGVDERKWVDLARDDLAQNYLQAGAYLVKAVGVMYAAPVPKEIEANPLHYFQYLEQLVEATIPLKNVARDYYLTARQDLAGVGLNEHAGRCLDKYAELEFRIGEDYERIGQRILKDDYQKPKDLSPDDQEELDFQLEDIVFELQDKAIFAYEDAEAQVKKNGGERTEWYRRIREHLARLSPEAHGVGMYVTLPVTTGIQWTVRSDSVAGWNAPGRLPATGWSAAQEAPTVGLPAFPGAQPAAIWHSKADVRRLFARREIFLNGFPREATIYLAVGGRYSLFVNGALASADTFVARPVSRLDSVANVGELFKGGDNVVALEAEAGDAARGVGLAVMFIVDTTQHFVPSAVGADAAGEAAGAAAKPETGEGAAAAGTGAASAPQTSAVVARPAESHAEAWNAKEFPSKRELLKAVEDYRARAATTELQIKKERMELQKQQIRQEYVEAQIKGVIDEIAALKKELDDLSRQK